MSGFQYRFLGAESLPNKLSDFDLNYYFRLSDDDVVALAAKFRTDRRSIAAIQMLFFRVTGTPLDRFATIPRNLLQYVGDRLSVNVPTIASLKTIYGRRQTLYEHQLWAKEYLGIVDADAAANGELDRYLRAQANEVTSIEDLLSLSRRWLYDRKLLIPRERALRDLARQCNEATDQNIYATILEVVTQRGLDKCYAAVFELVADEGSTTVLEWLKTAPKRHSPSTFSTTLDKIKFLKDLEVDLWKFDDIPLEKQRGYAQQMQARRPSKSKELKTSALAIELVFFLRITLLELTDSAIYQSGRRYADLLRRAYSNTQAKQARNSVTYRERLVSIKAVCDDKELSDKEFREKISEMISDIGDKPPSSHAAHVRQTLIASDDKRIRNLLHSMDGLNLQGNANDTSLVNLAKLREFYARKITTLPDQAFPTDRKWQELVDHEDRNLAFRALEASTAMAISKSLRRGTVWVSHSLTYRERDQMLIPPKEWENTRQRHVSNLGMPATADEFLEKVLGKISERLVALAEAKEEGQISIDDAGTIHVPNLESVTNDLLPKRTRDLLFDEIGQVQFPDLLLEVDSSTNFSECLLGRKAKDRHELVAVYAALIAHGTEIDARGVSAMIPNLEPGHVSSAMRALESHGRLRDANERVVQFQMKHEIAALWGGGKKASSDMMSIDVSKHLLQARREPRRKTHAVGIYTHVLDQFSVVYDQPIVLNERQAGPAIAGAEYYNSYEDRERLSFLAVDTHGYTNPGMAIAKGLGFDLCPQLRNLSERKLYLPRNFTVPDSLDKIVVREISISAIRRGWDEYLRVLASIRSGRVSANVVLQRFGSAAQGDALYKALDHLGRLLRTLFLCDYFSNPDFRREIHTVLNRGESIHLLQRAIYFGKMPVDRGRRADEMIAISGAHTLLTNVVIAWNTHQMQKTVSVWRKSGRPIEDAWLARMGPGHFSNINFRGTFSFGVDHYADMLLQRPAKASLRAG
ncbi:Tn3 family transposase [Undibacterium sp. CY18W]|uniref:Tn3 family transposase n=1 Tax=Undibacterium hunanense TaxID=2762292 RepID=A0ABR6ZMR8_9BURK|nr:Tn3 family transposase [Undibacterium hunanense]MBC3917094.1 Tn3 family transposase [Undibacterium hunanense]